MWFLLLLLFGLCCLLLLLLLLLLMLLDSLSLWPFMALHCHFWLSNFAIVGRPGGGFILAPPQGRIGIGVGVLLLLLRLQLLLLLLLQMMLLLLLLVQRCRPTKAYL